MKEGTGSDFLLLRKMCNLVTREQPKNNVPKLTQAIIESILVKGKGVIEVRFFDGTKFVIKY